MKYRVGTAALLAVAALAFIIGELTVIEPDPSPRYSTGDRLGSIVLVLIIAYCGHLISDAFRRGDN